MIRFDSSERKALVGINEGKYTLNLAQEMLKFRNEGMKLEEIADKFNAMGNYSNITPDIIDPLFNFLLKHEADDVLEYYQNYLNGIKIKYCEVCGEEFEEPKKVTGQTTCKTCRKKYTPAEIMVLKGYRTGKYNENIAMYAYSLREAGLNNRQIAEELNIPNNLVSPIIDLLLPDGFGKTDNNGEDNLENNGPKNICKYCGNEFSTKNSENELFCSDCNRKYDYLDLLLFIGIKESNYSFKLATEMYKLRKNGSSDDDISEKLQVPKYLINKILKHFGFNEEGINSTNNLNNCSVCGSLFVIAKGTSNQQYCPNCKGKLKNNQLRVLAGINNGIYNKDLAIKIKNLLDKGESKTSIAKKLKLPSSSVIDPIIEFLYEEEIPDFMKKNNSLSSNLSKNLFITSSNNQTNFKLKGMVSNEFAIDFMKILSKINFNINEIIFKEKGKIEFSVNFDVEDSHLDKLFSELINIGFE